MSAIIYRAHACSVRVWEDEQQPAASSSRILATINTCGGICRQTKLSSVTSHSSWVLSLLLLRALFLSLNNTGHRTMLAQVAQGCKRAMWMIHDEVVQTIRVSVCVCCLALTSPLLQSYSELPAPDLSGWRIRSGIVLCCSSNASAADAGGGAGARSYLDHYRDSHDLFRIQERHAGTARPSHTARESEECVESNTTRSSKPRASIHFDELLSNSIYFLRI